MASKTPAWDQLLERDHDNLREWATKAQERAASLTAATSDGMRHVKALTLMSAVVGLKQLIRPFRHAPEEIGALGIEQAEAARKLISLAVELDTLNEAMCAAERARAATLPSLATQVAETMLRIADLHGTMCAAWRPQ